MNEITLMNAIHRMYVHKDKKSPIRFLVTFDDGITRKASFGKSWSKTMKTWIYFVQGGAYEPRFPTRSVRQFQQSCRSAEQSCTAHRFDIISNRKDE